MNNNEKKLVNKTTNKAVALSYKSNDVAPKVIAKGKGITADKIIEKGLDENIAIYRDENLVENLISLELNEEIPEELYEAVAEIIFYIYNLDMQRGMEYGE